MLADVYWIRAIQYFAATRLKDKPTGPRDLLFPLLDITTSLDPAFNLAYRFGAIFLAERHRGGTFQPELAIKLLDKGFAQNPTRWEYLYDKAFVYYWTFHDPKAAAHWFSEAAKVPGSADWLPGLAAIMLVEGGDRRSSRFMFQQMLQTAEHEYMRNNAAFRLAQLDILDAIDQLNAILDRYQQVTGTRATTWDAACRAQLAARGARRPGRQALHDRFQRTGGSRSRVEVQPAAHRAGVDAAGAGRRRRDVPRPPA